MILELMILIVVLECPNNFSCPYNLTNVGQVKIIVVVSVVLLLPLTLSFNTVPSIANPVPISHPPASAGHSLFTKEDRNSFWRIMFGASLIIIIGGSPRQWRSRCQWKKGSTHILGPKTHLDLLAATKGTLNARIYCFTLQNKTLLCSSRTHNDGDVHFIKRWNLSFVHSTPLAQSLLGVVTSRIQSAKNISYLSNSVIIAGKSRWNAHWHVSWRFGDISPKDYRVDNDIRLSCLHYLLLLTLHSNTLLFVVFVV